MLQHKFMLYGWSVLQVLSNDIYAESGFPFRVPPQISAERVAKIQDDRYLDSIFPHTVKIECSD